MFIKKAMHDEKIRFIGLIGIVTVVFLIIFAKFVFLDYAYVFSVSGDIGSDTMNSYYPMLSFISKMLHAGNFDLTSLQVGLGENIINTFSVWCNPVDLLATFFPQSTLHIGMLLSTYLKIMIIATFGYLFFRNILNSKTGIIASTISWTFCSYIIIWGQHYWFATNMMNFTIFMFLLQKWLSGSKKIFIVFIPFMTFFCINSYYFFYISGIFAVFYTVAYMMFKNIKFKLIIKQLLKLAGFSLLALGIGIIIIYPILQGFMNSPRAGSIGLSNLSIYLKPYNIQLYLTDVARFLNPDLVGSGYTHFWTPTINNYYESAFLSSSIFCLFAIMFQLFYGKHRSLKFILLMIILVLLFFPLFTYLFTFNAYARRWTFFLIFIECICIGTFFDALPKLKMVTIRKIVILSSAIFVSFIVLLLLAEKLGYFNVMMIFMIAPVIFFAIYAGILYFLNFKHRNILLLCFLILEMIVINIPTLYFRGVEKSDDLNKKYGDGSAEAVQYLKNYDRSLYRISKNYMSVFLNDAMVQDYYGFNSYSSVNSKYLWDFNEIYTDPNSHFNLHPNYINIDDVMLEGLLGAKYVLSKTPIDDLKFIKKVNAIYIYENYFAAPFGYLYDQRVSNTLEKQNLQNVNQLLFGFYGKKAADFESITIGDDVLKSEAIDITSNIVSNLNLSKRSDGSHLIVSNEKKKAEIVFDFSTKLNTLEDLVDAIEFEIDVDNYSGLSIYCDTKNGFNKKEKITYNLVEGKNNFKYNMRKFRGIKRIKLVIEGDNESVKLNKAVILKSNLNTKAYIEKFNDHALENVSFSNSTLRGIIKNGESDQKMLMIPMTYDDNWKATLNNKNAKIYKINNGLMGIKINKGTFNVKLKYSIKNVRYLAILSIVSILIFIFMIYRSLSNKKK